MRKLGSPVELPYLHRIELAYATRLVQRESVILGGMVGGESTGADADEPSPAAPETERKVRDLGHYVPRGIFSTSRFRFRFVARVVGRQECRGVDIHGKQIADRVLIFSAIEAVERL